MLKNKRLIPYIILVLFLILPITLTASGCGRVGSRQEKAVYYCPMHPTYTSDRPGDCPICNMKLVKRESEPQEKGLEPPKRQDKHEGHIMQTKVQPAKEKTIEEVCIEHLCTMNNCPMRVATILRPGERVICPICGEVISTSTGKVVEITQKASQVKGPTVHISAEKQQLVGVKTEAVTKRKLTKVIRAAGKIAYDPELYVTQEEFIQALKNEENVKDSPIRDVLERATTLTEAARRKLKLLGMSDEQIAELENKRNAQTGLYLPGKEDRVWAYISVYEYEIGLMSPGQDVEIEAVAYPGETFRGVIRSIYPVLDPLTRTNQIRVEVENRDGKLKPQMFVNANIKIDMGSRLAVPEGAILDTGLRKIVYISREGDLLESREVKIGQKAEGYYEVLEGLTEGDIVVTSGTFLIDSESKLKSALGEETHKHGQ